MDLTPSTHSLDPFKVQQNKRNAEKDIEPSEVKKTKQDDQKTIEIKFSESESEILLKLSENKTSKIRLNYNVYKKNNLLEKWFSEVQTGSDFGDFTLSLNEQPSLVDDSMFDDASPAIPPAAGDSNNYIENLLGHIVNPTISTNPVAPNSMSDVLDVSTLNVPQPQHVIDDTDYRDQFFRNIVSIEYNFMPKTFYHNKIPRQLEYVRFRVRDINQQKIISFSISPVVIYITPRSVGNNWAVSSKFEVGRANLVNSNDLKDIQELRKKITSEKNLESLIRLHKNNKSDSIDELIYNKLGGNMFWKLESRWIYDELVELFFPGIDLGQVATVKMFKENMNSLLDNIHNVRGVGTTENFTVVYYGVKFKFAVTKSFTEEINFMLNLSGLIDTVENNEDKLLVDLFYEHGYLLIKRFYTLDDDKSMDKYHDKILLRFDQMSLQNDNKSGKRTKREFLFIRLIANLIRSTGRNVVGIQVESKKENKTKQKWQEFRKQFGWETRNMGDGEKNTVDNLENYGFFGIGMKGISEEGNVTTFEPWVKNTGANF